MKKVNEVADLVKFVMDNTFAFINNTDGLGEHKRKQLGEIMLSLGFRGSVEKEEIVKKLSDENGEMFDSIVEACRWYGATDADKIAQRAMRFHND